MGGEFTRTVWLRKWKTKHAYGILTFCCTLHTISTLTLPEWKSIQLKGRKKEIWPVAWWLRDWNCPLCWWANQWLLMFCPWNRSIAIIWHLFQILGLIIHTLKEKFWTGHSNLSFNKAFRWFYQGSYETPIVSISFEVPLVLLDLGLQILHSKMSTFSVFLVLWVSKEDISNSMCLETYRNFLTTPIAPLPQW
jgi:hypothetical protein